MVRVRTVIGSILLGLPLVGIGCAGAPEAADEAPADLEALRKALATAQPSASPPPYFAPAATVGSDVMRERPPYPAISEDSSESDSVNGCWRS